MLHFTNGILDLTDNKFRQGRPNDYVSLTTGYEFEEFNNESLEVMMVDDHLSKVFPDPELKQYYMQP